jgi:hypothetical protein
MGKHAQARSTANPPDRYPEPLVSLETRDAKPQPRDAHEESEWQGAPLGARNHALVRGDALRHVLDGRPSSKAQIVELPRVDGLHRRYEWQEQRDPPDSNCFETAKDSPDA